MDFSSGCVWTWLYLLKPIVAKESSGSVEYTENPQSKVLKELSKINSFSTRDSPLLRIKGYSDSVCKIFQQLWGENSGWFFLSSFPKVTKGESELNGG